MTKILQTAAGFLLAAALPAAQAAAGPDKDNYGSYSGHGGMTAYRIAPEAYRYHYNKGFTGIDAMGWNSNLQFAWSRIGAALTCNIPADTGKLTEKLIAEYGYDVFAHRMNGFEFHALQSKGINGFCTQARIEEINRLIPEMENGRFEKRF